MLTLREEIAKERFLELMKSGSYSTSEECAKKAVSQADEFILQVEAKDAIEKFKATEWLCVVQCKSCGGTGIKFVIGICTQCNGTGFVCSR